LSLASHHSGRRPVGLSDRPEGGGLPGARGP
jgi:hypothetical protein